MSSDPYKVLEPSHNFPWYLPNIDKKVTPEVRKLLETYSKIPPEDVLKHVHDIRDKAWAIRPYPCTGLGNFVSPMIAKSAIYPTVLSRLNQGASFLDVGCFLGQDLRRLVFDGAPSNNLYAVDIVDHWTLGYELFRDSDKPKPKFRPRFKANLKGKSAAKFRAKFIESDLMAPNREMQALAGKIDIISVTHVLHQWEWEGQIAAAKQLAALSHPGSMIIGYQVGTSAGASKQRSSNNETFSWMRQDPETWKEMWEVIVSGALGMEWKSESQLKTFAELGFDEQEVAYLGEDARLLEFVVRRIL